MPAVVAADNPELANQIVEAALAGVDMGPTSQERPAHETAPLPETTWTLPGGYITSKGDVATEIEVCELTGFDEEAIAKCSSLSKLMTTVLMRGVVKVGELDPNTEIFNRMLTGDREMALLAIYSATYGNEIHLNPVSCPHCGDSREHDLDLTKDIEVKILDDISQRQFEVKLQKGVAQVVLPDGAVQNQVLDFDGTEAEARTIVLRNCVDSINGIPVVNEDSVRRLGIKDRGLIIESLNKRSIGPQFAAAKKECPSCKEDINLPLNILEMFR